MTSWRPSAFWITSPQRDCTWVMRNFDVFVVVGLKYQLDKQSSCRWFETPLHSCDVHAMSFSWCHYMMLSGRIHAPITINSLCLTWSKVVSLFFFLIQTLLGDGNRTTTKPETTVGAPTETPISCCECPRLNSAHVDRNTPEEYSKACVVASTGRLTMGRSLSLTRPYDNPPSLVTELLISQDFPQRHFCTCFTVR